MAIDFNAERWEITKRNYRRWWAGELERPLIQLSWIRDPGRPAPAHPYRGVTAHYGPEVTAGEIVDSWDFFLSMLSFRGDSFPCMFPNFGPGVVAAFLGARLENGQETSWFVPEREHSAADLELRYDEGNYWLKRVRDVVSAAMERWQGSVQMAMTDLGGNLDIIYSFLPGDKLFYELYDGPEAIKKLVWDVHDLWWRYFNEFSCITAACPGTSAWAPLFSEEPYYMLQCDFAYNIGPAMFEEFVMPELSASCKKLGNAFFHLDGPGMLPHLDLLLSIPELRGVQWIPGAGRPGVSEWPEVYRKIRKAGKLVQLYGTVADLDAVASQVGGAEGILLVGSASSEEEITAALKRYGADRDR